MNKITTGKTIFRATVLIASLSLLSKLLGFLRDVVIAGKFGAGSLTDAYLFALTVPNSLFFIISGALAAVAVPVFVDFAVKGKKEDAWQVFNTVFNIVTPLFIFIAVVGVVYAPNIINLISITTTQKEMAETAVELTRIMFPLLLFAGWASLFTGLLNANNVFGIPALSTSVNNIIIILATVTLGRYYGIHGVAAGTVLAMSAMALVQTPALYRAGYRYKPVLDLGHPGVKQVFLLLLPALLGTTVNQGYILIERILASGMQEGTIAVLNLANKLVQMPISLVVVALTTAAFPVISRMAATAAQEEFSISLNKLLRVLLLIMLPVSVSLMILSQPVADLLFKWGKFSEESVDLTAVALLFYSVGLTGQAANIMLAKAFYAWQDTKTPVIITAVTVLVNLCLSLFLIRFLQHGGLALANSLASLTGMVLFMILLKRRVKSLQWAGLGKFIMVTGVVSALTAAGCYGVNSVLPTLCNLPPGKLGLIIQISITGMAGIAVFSAAAWFLKIEEFRTLLNYLKAAFNDRRSKK